MAKNEGAKVTPISSGIVIRLMTMPLEIEDKWSSTDLNYVNIKRSGLLI